MLEAEEIYKRIEESDLSTEEQERLHDWYRERHIKVTEKAHSRLDRLHAWREREISKLQKKVLRRLR